MPEKKIQFILFNDKMKEFLYEMQAESLSSQKPPTKQKSGTLGVWS